MATKTVRIARHVYLRTQQRRLRHVKSLYIRNLSLPDPSYSNPLAISVYFTIHSIHSPSKVLYQSAPVQETYNPSWESLQFTVHQYTKHAALSCFILRLWVESGEEEGEEYLMVCEKKVELADLLYLGPSVNKDGSGYPPNSVVFGMFEGYYSYPGVGGVLCPPKVTHTLSDFLPPQSLMEVQKSEVSDAYHKSTLAWMLNRQEVLNKAIASASTSKDTLNDFREAERSYFSKRREREQLRTRLQLLRQQLQEQERLEREERETLVYLREELDTTEGALREKQENLRRSTLRFEEDNMELGKKIEKLSRVKRNRQLRQRNMLYEVAQTFFIKEVDTQFTICNVILPNADQLDQPSSVEQLGVALGYVAHLVSHLSQILLLPLLYPVKPQGSKSLISDHISDAVLIDNITDFPLYAKGAEKALFQYAVHLLNKDIAQIRQHCRYVTSRTNIHKTLPNLKFLLDKLTKDVAPSLLPDAMWRMSIPMDSVSLNSYTTADNVSLASTLSLYPSTYRGHYTRIREEGEEEHEPKREASPTATPPLPVAREGNGHSPNPTTFPMSLPHNGTLEDVSGRGEESAASDVAASPGHFSPFVLPSKEANMLSINASDDDVQPLDFSRLDATQHRRMDRTEPKETTSVQSQLPSEVHATDMDNILTALEERQMSHFSKFQAASSPTYQAEQESVSSHGDRSRDCAASLGSRAVHLGSPGPSTDEAGTSVVELQTYNRAETPSAPEPTAEEDRNTEVGMEDEPSGQPSVTLIPHHLALTLGLTPDDSATGSSQIELTPNTLSGHSQYSSEQPALLSYHHSSSYGKHFHDGGIVSSDLATPHMVSRYHNSTAAGTGNGQRLTSRTSRHASSQDNTSDTQFLEDFIDTPSEHFPYRATQPLRPRQQVVTDRDRKRFV